MATVQNESSDTPADVHLPWLWARWGRNQTWRDKLAKKAAHKSLDIPEDDMNINNTRTGIGTAGMIGIAAAAGLPGIITAALLGYSTLKQPAAAAPTPPVVPVVQQPPVDSAYDVLFYDKDGNPITVPNISQRK